MSAEPDVRFLTGSQRRVIGFALTLTALLASATLLVLAFIALGRLAAFFSGVLWPLALAGVLALMLRPLVELFEVRLKIRRLAAVILLYGLVGLVLWGALLLVLPPLIDQLINFIVYLPTFWHNATQYVDRNYPDWIALINRQLANPMIRQVVDNLNLELKSVLTSALPSLKAAGIGALGVFTFSAHLAIIPIYLFFFLLSRGEPTKNLGGHLAFLGKNVQDDIIFLVREFIGIVVSFFRGQLLIGLIMGVLLALGFSLVGLKFGLFIGLALGVLNIVPYLGTIIGLAVTLPLAFFQQDGGWKLVALVLVVKIIVQNIEGWFLTPKIMGDRTGLHPVTIIVAIFFWGTAFGGVLGMLFAIPLTAFFVTLWRLLRHKYFGADPTV
ncbi:MAG: AI-2E family transporter [Opitutaceae bacterium]|nr:AI-2E family transporter [Opitutaceae bacterium]